MNTQTPFLSAVLTRLRAHKHGELYAIAIATGIPEGTLRKLYYGEVKDPRISTVEALHEHFLRDPGNAHHA